MAVLTNSLAEPVGRPLLPASEILKRWRSYHRTVRRWRAFFWSAIVFGMIGLLVVVRSGAASSPCVLLSLAAALLGLGGLLRLHARYLSWLAGKWGLVCQECNRPLDESTITFALDTGQCWHCHPPILAEDISGEIVARTAHEASDNPYQSPANMEPGPPASVSPPKPPAAVSELSFGMSLVVGPLGLLLVHKLLTCSEEVCCQNNPPPRPFESADEEAAHRRRIVTIFRRQGWYLLAWMTLIPGSALGIVWLSQRAYPPASAFDRMISFGLVYVLASGIALWTANKVNRHGPRPLSRWLGAVADPIKAQLEPESGLVCIQLMFPPSDLSSLPARRRLSIRWRSEESRPLNVTLWRQGRGAIHRQQLPYRAAAGQWNDDRCLVPYALAGEDARWSEVKVLFSLDPPGPLEVSEVVT